MCLLVLPTFNCWVTILEDPAVTLFRQYLRLKTVQPEPDYEAAIVFLRRIIEEIGLEHKTIAPDAKKPILIATWIGLDPSLPTILLNSHTDVVPVYADLWKHDPFEAIKDTDGKIYGRGTQDMKCVTIQYLEAIRNLKNQGIKLKRTIHLTFMPDEEIGGVLGMQAFLRSEEWKEMNVGFALDEGLANPINEFTVFFGERMPWWVKVSFPGNPGHGSRFIEGTAAEKLRTVINRFLDFRQQEKNRLEANPELTLGDVTSVNLTKIEGGIQVNVVPSELVAYFDIRVTPHADLDDMLKQVYEWCKEAGDDVQIEFIQYMKDQTLTSIEPGNIWWDAFSSACESMKMKIKCEIFPAGTDCRFLREIGLPALGFSPINLTPILLHDHNEFIEESVFLRGIPIYEAIIPALGNA